MSDDLSNIHIDEDRLDIERKAMRQAFPEATLLRVDSDGTLGWRVGIVIDETVYDVVMIYPENYPYRILDIYVIGPELDSNQTPHMHPDGSLSLSSTREWKPSYTAVRGVLLAAKWLEGKERYQAKGVWPDEKLPLGDTTTESVETVETA